MCKAESTISEAFRSGAGLRWGEHDAGLFEGTERFFRPGYIGNLVAYWIPALDGVEEKLERGATVADIGCGHGASTIIMAQAYPQSRFLGFDSHAPSIERRPPGLPRPGLADRVIFEVAERIATPRRSPVTTCSPTSTACMIWPTLLAPAARPFAPWRPTARC